MMTSVDVAMMENVDVALMEGVDVAMIHSTPVLGCGKVKTGLLWPLAVPGQPRYRESRPGHSWPGSHHNININI